jgi:hypothetical protein
MKKQQQTLRVNRRNVLVVGFGIAVVVAMAFGYGYFFGRYEQIQLNRSVLKPIPDVNCSQEVH